MWTTEDTLLAMALIHIEDDTCVCGQPMSESMDPGHDPDGGHHRYHAGPPARCHACTAISEAALPYRDPEKTPHAGALRFSVDLIPRGSRPPT